MTLYAKIEDSKVRKLIDVVAPPPTGLWVDASGTPGVWVGWDWNGSTFSAPATTYRKQITPGEWMALWTPDEWKAIRDLNAVDSVMGKLMNLLTEAIKLSPVVDLTDPWTIQYYTNLVTEAIIDEARKTALIQGIAE